MKKNWEEKFKEKIKERKQKFSTSSVLVPGGSGYISIPALPITKIFLFIFLKMLDISISYIISLSQRYPQC